MTLVQQETFAQRPGLVRVVQAPAPWEGYLIPVSGFPVPDEELLGVREVLHAFTGWLARDPRLLTEVFVQMAQLHVGDGSERLSSHGREWLPALGLGVWPNRPAPTLWTREDFENLGPGEAPRTIMFQVFRITAPGAAPAAREQMLGLGTVLQMMFYDSPGSSMASMREVLLKPIQDRAYTCFPFYVPLLDVDAVSGASAEHLDEWCGGAQVYVRESAEDCGILLLSKLPLRPVVPGLNAAS